MNLCPWQLNPPVEPEPRCNLERTCPCSPGICPQATQGLVISAPGGPEWDRGQQDSHALPPNNQEPTPRRQPQRLHMSSPRVDVALCGTASPTESASVALTASSVGIVIARCLASLLPLPNRPPASGGTSGSQVLSRRQCLGPQVHMLRLWPHGTELGGGLWG